MEATLQLTPLRPFGSSIFTNTRSLWHPAGARGIYGGGAIAQSLLAAYKTLPSTDYIIHSMHCYFVLAGDGENPVVYYVERVRDGKGFVTRTVQARQFGRVIFTTTMSFMRRGAGGEKQIRHAVGLPEGVAGTCPQGIFEHIMTEDEKRELEGSGVPTGDKSPFHSWRFPVLTKSPDGKPLNHSDKKTRNWMRVRGRISDNSSSSTSSTSSSSPDTAEHGEPLDRHVPHVCALAYMSDSYFMATVPRVHNAVRPFGPESLELAIQNIPEGPEKTARTRIFQNYLAEIAEAEADHEQKKHDSEIGMMVSLDHTIFFHNPEHFRADEWMFGEIVTPWAGDGRGLVMQHIWSKDGILIATCVQEGVLRVKQDRRSKL